MEWDFLLKICKDYLINSNGSITICFIYKFKTTKNTVLQFLAELARCFNKNLPKIGLFDMPYFTIKRKDGKYGKRI